MTLKTLAYSVLVLSTLGGANEVFAHSLTFKTLRSQFGASATDVWQVTCNSDAVLGNTHHLSAQILDRSGDTVFLPLVIVKGNNAVTTVDPTGGDGNMSPLVSLAGGNGTYSLLVNYTRAVNQIYNIEFHCENAAGSHTPTTTPTLPVQDN